MEPLVIAAPLAEKAARNEPQPVKSAFPEASDPADKNLVSRRVRADDSVWIYDRYGRQGFITRAEWRKTLLPQGLRKVWIDPEALANAITIALENQCGPDVLEAAHQLLQIDSIRPRAVCLLAEVLIQSGQVPEAEKILQTYLNRHGDQAGVLAALGKIQYGRNRSDRSEKLLWRAVELDPNEKTAVWGCATIANERGGAAAQTAALEQIAKFPQSWRAQTGLAWAAVQERNLETAIRYYTDALLKAPLPTPVELLGAISNALVSQGHLPEMINLVGPAFSAKLHGLAVGGNLMRAHIDLGQLDSARRILTQLRDLKVLAWDSELNAWEMEIAMARREVADPVRITPENFRLLALEGPIWIDPASPIAKLFPAKNPDAPRITFLLHTVELESSEGAPARERNALEMFSRIVPFFLAEQTEFFTQARANVVVPWVRDAGIYTYSAATSDEQAASAARAMPTPPDYTVTGHLKVDSNAAILELRLVRVRDGKHLGSVSAPLEIDQPEVACFQLAGELVQLAHAETGVALISPPGQYRPPGGPDFVKYLLALDDLLCVRCVGTGPVSPEYWIGERAILDRGIRLCLEFPRNACVRLVLAQTVFAMRQTSPKVLPEFKDKLTFLEQEHGLSEPTNGVVQSIFTAATADGSVAE